MILQELCNLYDRIKDDPDYDIPSLGFIHQNVVFAVVLNPDGTLFDIVDECVQKNGKAIPKKLKIPGNPKPTGSGINSQILCDNKEFMLGFFEPKDEQELSAEKKKEQRKKIERTPKCFEEFKKKHLALRGKISAPQFQAVCNFLENWDVQSLTDEQKNKIDGNGVFKIVGENRYVHDIEEVKTAILNELSEKQDLGKEVNITCLVSGQKGSLARLHEPKIKGVRGAQTSGAGIVSFNSDAFESFGKKQGANAPVSEESVWKYCSALNALLRVDKHHFYIGGTTIVFWTAQKTQMEGLFAKYFNPPLKSKEEKNSDTQDDGRLKELETFWETVRNAGTPQSAFDRLQSRDSSETPFFMLGLSPAASRLSVRFWHAGTLGGFLERLKAHHSALQIQKMFPDSDRDFISIWRILNETVRDSKDISPVLGGELMRSILEGTPYPSMLLSAILRRIAASSGNKCGKKVSYNQARIIKAVLVRNFNKLNESKKMETIDPQNENVAYRLGRLFAVIEKVQSEANENKEVNAGVGDKYFSSASCTPSVVFPTLIDLHQKHLSKLGKRIKKLEVNRDKLVGEILSTIKQFPKTLSIEERGLFALGYYHQMRDLFPPKKEEKETADATASENK